MRYLADSERPLDAQQRNARKHNRALANRIHLDLARVEREQVVEEAGLPVRKQALQRVALFLLELVVGDETNGLFEAAKDGEFAADKGCREGRTMRVQKNKERGTSTSIFRENIERK